MSGELQIRIDRDACQAAQVCVHRAPGTFKLGDDGKAQAQSPPTEPESAVLEAARGCPNFAIAVSRDGERLD